ncbi:MarR family winged helix-turn-helix transcriptional regulator [Nocardia otitidiscaviarum]|uniref:MarR family winged helix-turn-helix transcriptional regulator n=1 Tax=Nocardia otitidiscaviarum TaxID=1823 RepID=UPI002456AA17|nr:MarR family transcriptional regulator [Nocardia otitidiscaviarum]
MPPPKATSASDPTATAGAASDVVAHIVELERAMSRLAYLLTRARRHDRAVTACGITVDRASVPLLRILADAAAPLRLGELAVRLDVEAPHVTRQVQRLEKNGFVGRVADPDDRRAQLVRLTDSGRAAVDAIRAVQRRWMREALADWSSEDLRTLATLNHRMLDDFAEHTRCLDESGIA